MSIEQSPGQPYRPAGTVYGVLLNSNDEFAALAGQMTSPPYKAAPRAPVLYIKTANTWNPGGGVVALPPQTPEISVGATIGMLIGATAPANRAHVAIDSIAGMVLMNDFSIPHASFFRPPVKFNCLDGFLGMAAHTVTPEQAGDPARLSLEVRINGELRHTVDFSQMRRNAAQLLVDVNEFMTLREGDVLMLGCGAGRPLAKAGDRVDISVPGVPAFGVLSHTLVGAAK
ncbi:MAG: fumarylacetoacetate hydrolase family protein [Polaromonas sp.]